MNKQLVKEKVNHFFDKYVFPHWNRWYCALVILASVVICLCAVPNWKTIEYDPTPGAMYGKPEYVTYTDSILKNRLDFDIDPSPELLALENPYTPEGRDGIVYFLWDTAFYEGRYFCYFGITPVFTVYLPFFWITGKMPENINACTILGIYAVIFIVLAVFEMAKRVVPKAPPWIVAVSALGMVWITGVYNCISDAKMYVITLLSGIGCGYAFLFFALRGLRAKKKWAQGVLLALSGIFFVGIVESRPSMAIAFMSFLPLIFVDIFKSGKWKERVLKMVYLGTPVAIGAILIMWYNAARFSGPFDFGNSYQLTVHDCTTYTMSLALFPYAFSHYFLQGPSYSGKFPLLIHQSYCIMDYGRYEYVDRCLGVFAYPATLMSFFTPVAWSFKKDLGKTLTYICIPLFCIFIAWSDTCMGGVHFRYVFDILGVFAFPAIMTWMEIVCRSKGKMKVNIIVVGIGLIVITILMFLSLICANDPDPDFLFHRPVI